MAISKAAKGQRRRRRKELKAKESQEATKATQLKTNRKVKSKTVITIPDSADTSESEDDIQFLTNNEGLTENEETHHLTSEEIVEETADVFENYDNELDERKKTNDLVQYIEASKDDDTSDEEDLEDENEPLQNMFSSLFGPPLKIECNPRRVLKSGKSHYQQPVLSSNASSQKLVPSALPRQTKHDRKKKQIKALGVNNNMMQNYLIRKSVENIEPAINSNLEQPIEATINQLPITNTNLNEIQEYYLANPQSTTLTLQEKSVKAQVRWEQLNTAINTVTALLKEKAKKDKKFIFPQIILDNLKEFNSLRYQFTISGTKLPSEAAALATAQSSLRQHSKKNHIQHQQSGIYLARKIVRQACHIVTHQELLLPKQGNHKNHQSLLDNMKLRESLFKWAAEQVPGAVSNFIFFLIYPVRYNQLITTP